MMRCRRDGFFEYAVYATPTCSASPASSDPIIAGPLVHRDLPVALQNWQGSSLEPITFRF
ncbi:MAG: hypothetical protein AUF79_11060 [Crenarchaeota archaeon 13_1_20CM_2_51_8]|nr:MAG: hypothetical protein AUF79_11060 [Crenarchaeota archaeon 13_1_20CM_2_51_8]